LGFGQLAADSITCRCEVVRCLRLIAREAIYAVRTVFLPLRSVVADGLLHLRSEIARAQAFLASASDAVPSRSSMTSADVAGLEGEHGLFQQGSLWFKARIQE